MVRAFCVVASTIGLFLVTAPQAFADSPTGSSYRQAVQQAYDLILNAKPTETAPGAQAAGVLRSATGRTQPEILADLLARPPDYEDARARLQDLISALDQPATTDDPALAQQRLHEVMSQSRYDALHRPPSPLDLVVQWVRDRITELLRALFGGSGGPRLPELLLYIVGAAILLVLAVIVFLSTRGRFMQTSVASMPAAPRATADYFDEADRLASRGDRVGAIRALCAGVAAALSGEQTWEGSPLTVREIFQHASDHQSLQPLLMPFEAAVYGGRDVDKATYERAAQVAATYRQPAARAA
jgi:hypothetical protein